MTLGRTDRIRFAVLAILALCGLTFFSDAILAIARPPIYYDFPQMLRAFP